MYSKLIFIGLGVHPSSFENQGLQYLLSKYHVEFWNVLSIYAEAAPVVPYGAKQHHDVALKIDTLADFHDRLSMEIGKPTFFVLEMPSVHYARALRLIVLAITTNSFRYAIMDCGNSFSPKRDTKHFWRNTLKQWLRMTPLGFKNRKRWFWSEVEQPCFALVASKFVENDNRIRGIKTKFIRAHSRDFESYLHLGSPRYQEESYAVFLDQSRACPDCLDHVLFSQKPKVGVSEYYSEVGRFMTSLIEHVGLHYFVIACHPSNLLSDSEIFHALTNPNAKVVRYATPSLVKDSTIVVGEDSSAFGLAVLYEKPVAIYFPTETQNSKELPLAENFARLLGRKVNYGVPIDIDWGINPAKYFRFRTRYVKEVDTSLLSLYNVLDMAISCL